MYQSNRNIFRHIILLGLFVTLVCLQSWAQADTVSKPTVGISTVTLKDAVDVAGAVANISDKLKQQGFIIPLTVNHSAAATSVGLELASNQVIFARPTGRLEQRLLSQGVTVGIDLPLKFHVFEQNGEIKLSVNTMGYLFDRHDLQTQDVVHRIVDKAVEQFGATGLEGNGLVTVPSNRSVTETVEALKAAILTNPDARIPLVINYGRRVNSPVLVVFGNARVGTPLMQADPRIGIDLPLKFLVWEDKGGVKITYNDPHFLAGRIDLQGVDARLAAVANALKNIAAAGAGG